MSTAEIPTEEIGNVFIIRLPVSIDTNFKSKFEIGQIEWLTSTAKIYVLDLSRVMSFTKNSYSAFAQFAQVLKKKNKTLHSFGVNEKMNRQFSMDGITQMFNMVKNLDEILVRYGAHKKSSGSLDSNFINPFINSTISVLKTRAQIIVTPGKPYTVKSKPSEIEIGLAAVITLVHSNFSGVISLEFSTAVFLQLYESMLGEKQTAINDKIKAFAGEIINSIFGQAKTELSKKNYQLDNAMPTILVGDDLKVHHTNNAAALIIPLQSPIGDFNLHVSLNS